jgi:hypothetical protein
MHTIVTAADNRFICNIVFSFFVTLAVLFKIESWLSVLIDDASPRQEERRAVYGPPLRVRLKDQETQPDEALPKGPITSQRLHEADTRCVSIPAISRLLGAESPINLYKGTTQRAARIG